MPAFIFFVLSGIILVVLLLAKYIERKHQKEIFILKAISLGDERLHRAREEAVDYYLRGKDKAAFFLKKQLPLKARSLWNKSLFWSKNKTRQFIGDLRDSRLLKKKPDGLSEFFKNISQIEKGNGEINDEVYTPVQKEPEKPKRKRR